MYRYTCMSEYVCIHIERRSERGAKLCDLSLRR